MRDKFFLDTNILVYTFDSGELEKKNRAMALVSDALQTGDGSISSQVVQEFLNVATRKFAKKMTESQARLYLNNVLWPLCKVVSDVLLFEDALEIQARFELSFYDSLIVSGAIRAEAKILYTEDLQDGLSIKGLQIVNPFS